MGSESQLALSRSKHYFQGGYDVDFAEELDPQFECPICLLCQRDPYQTSCGHRFCYSCIVTWINEQKTCPKDACSLGAGDIFADTMAGREILQLLVKCPYKDDGCKDITRLSDAENHARQCKYARVDKNDLGDIRVLNKSTSKQESLTCESCSELLDEEAKTHHGPRQLICPNARIACTFASAGCEEKVSRKDLGHHIQTQTHKHMQLISEKLLKLHQIQGASQPTLTEETSFVMPSDVDSGPDSLPNNDGSNPLVRTDVRLSGSNIQCTQKLMKDLFHRVVQLEQKNCQLEIHNDQLTKRVKEMEETTAQPELGRYCNGTFIWRIPDFNAWHERMRHSRSCILYSQGFYTSVFGYKVCLRCNVNIVNGEEHLALYVHMMRGENDDCLQWPFRGRIVLTVINMDTHRLCKNDFTESMEADKVIKSLERPKRQEERNPYGYGFPEFIRVNGLYSHGFVTDDNKLVIKAIVQSDS